MWRWHVWAPVPTRRVTLAESLLHSGPQFPHLYGGVEAGTWGNLEAPRQLSSTPRSRAAWELQPSSPSPQADRGRGSRGLPGGRQPEVCAPPGPLWGRGKRLDSGKWRVGFCRGLTNMGACGAAATASAGPGPSPLTAGGAPGSGCAGEARRTRNPQTAGNTGASPTWGNRGLS